MGRGLKETFFQRRFISFQKTWKDVLHCYSLRKCKSKQHGLSLQTCQDGHYQKNRRSQVLVRMQRHWNPSFISRSPVGGDIKCCSHYENQCGSFSKKVKIGLPYDPAISLLGIYPKEFKAGSQRENLHRHFITTFIIAKR